MTLSGALFETLLQSLWQVSLIALCAAVVLARLRRAGPAFCHAAAMVSLVTMLVVPLITFALCLGGDAHDLSTPLLLVRLPAALTAALQDWAGPLWLAGAGAMLLAHGTGLAWLARLHGRAVPLPAHWDARLASLRRAMGVGRVVGGRLVDGLAGPFTACLVKPVIYLPAVLLTRLPPEQIEALLAHELAHIRRLDWLWNGIGCVAEALLFFHPAVWWLGREIRRQRELACDELAVAAGIDGIVLAQALAGLARSRAQSLQQAGVPAARLVLHADGGALKERISRLLGGAETRSGWKLPALLVLALLVSMVTGQGGAVRFGERAAPAAIPASPPIPAPPDPPRPPQP